MMNRLMNIDFLEHFLLLPRPRELHLGYNLPCVDDICLAVNEFEASCKPALLNAVLVEVKG